MVKTELEAQIDKLPDEFSIEELILIEKNNIGEEQSINGQVISDDELEKEMKIWFA